MTDNEIIKALECCSSKPFKACGTCPFLAKCDNDWERLIDIINRQKAEIEHIKQMYEAAVAGQETLQKCYHNYGQGEWIPLEPEIGLFACSLCDHRILRAECNFCPNCGAKMKGE